MAVFIVDRGGDCFEPGGRDHVDWIDGSAARWWMMACLYVCMYVIRPSATPLTVLFANPIQSNLLPVSRRRTRELWWCCFIRCSSEVVISCGVWQTKIVSTLSKDLGREKGYIQPCSRTMTDIYTITRIADNHRGHTVSKTCSHFG